jgi:hypothetical protein
MGDGDGGAGAGAAAAAAAAVAAAAAAGRGPPRIPQPIRRAGDGALVLAGRAPQAASRRGGERRFPSWGAPVTQPQPNTHAMMDGTRLVGAFVLERRRWRCDLMGL